MSIHRILLLTPDAPHTGGGIDQYLQDITGAIQMRFSDCCIHQVCKTGADYSCNITKQANAGHILHDSTNSVISFIRQSIRVTRLQQPQLVVCAHINLLPIAVLAARLAKCPLILLAYGIDVWRAPGYLQSNLIHHVTQMVAISRYTRDQLVHNYNVDASKVRLLPNCIHPVAVQSVEATTAFQQRYKLSGQRVILTVGRMAKSERYKGHDRVIAALPNILGSMPNVVYLVVGDGDDVGYLKQIAVDYQVENKVIFAGRLSDADRALAYASADCFTMPSSAEGFGFVFLEARSYQLPVVALNAAGARDALVDGELGKLVDDGDGCQLGLAIYTALNSPKTRYPGLKRFRFERFAQHLEDLLTECVNHYAYSSDAQPSGSVQRGCTKMTVQA